MTGELKLINPITTLSVCFPWHHSSARFSSCLALQSTTFSLLLVGSCPFCDCVALIFQCSSLKRGALSTSTPQLSPVLPCRMPKLKAQFSERTPEVSTTLSKSRPRNRWDISNRKSLRHRVRPFPILSGMMQLAETTLHHGNQPLTQRQHRLRRRRVQRSLKYQKRKPVHC